ncbi:hypothetical protein CsSME_00006509 [Camellia sinensis var. sinensis]
MVAESDSPLGSKPAPFSASTNHVSDLASSSREPIEAAVSGLARKRNRRRRAVFNGVVGVMRSYSSIMFSRSSLVVTEMRESSSSLGSWYLRVKWRLLRSVQERREERSKREEWRSITTMRVTPPM